MLYLPPDPKPGQLIRADTITAILKYLRQITPRTSATCDVQIGAGGATHHPRKYRRRAGLLSSQQAAWPFKVYNTTMGATGQVQINGNDGQIGTINSYIGCVNGTAINAQTGSPAAYPQLAITGNGYIYIQVALNSGGTINNAGGVGGTGVDVLFNASAPLTLDTASPPTYATQLLATVTNYASSGGKTSFTLSQTTGTGFSGFQLCGLTPLFW